MVAGHVSKDSWSRCEAPSMLYDTVRNPSAQTPPKISISAGKDTIESTQQRLQREMLDKFQNKGLELPHESYIAVVQVGKYMFLAVMLPVYLCFYGAPRWLLIQALPQVFWVIKYPFVKFGRLILKMTRRVQDLMKGALQQLIGDALKLSRECVKNLLKHFSAIALKFFKPFSFFSKAIASCANSIKNGALNLLKEVYEKAEHNAQVTNQWIIVSVKETIKRMAKKNSVVFNSLKKRFITPFFERFAEVLKKIKNTGEFLKAKIVSQMEISRNWLKKVSDPVFIFFNEALKLSKKITKQCIDPFVVWIEKRKERVLHRLKKVKKTYIDPISNAAIWIKDKAETTVVAAFAFFKPSFVILSSSVKRVAKSIGKKYPQRFKQPKVFATLAGTLKQATKVGGKSLVAIAGFGKKILVQLGRALIYLAKAFRYFIQTLFKQLMAFPRKIKKLLTALFKAISFVVARFIFAAHVLVAFIWVLSVYSFLLAHQFANPSSKKLP